MVGGAQGVVVHAAQQHHVVAQVQRRYTRLHELTLRAFADYQITNDGTLGEYPGHDLGEEMHHALTLDEPAHGEQHFAPAQAIHGGRLQIAHTLGAVLVGELAQVHSIRYDLAQRSGHAAPDALVAGVAAHADDLVHAPEALGDKPLVQPIVVSDVKAVHRDNHRNAQQHLEREAQRGEQRVGQVYQLHVVGARHGEHGPQESIDDKERNEQRGAAPVYRACRCEPPHLFGKTLAQRLHPPYRGRVLAGYEQDHDWILYYDGASGDG